MKLPYVLPNGNSRPAKLALVAALVVAISVWFAGTDLGRRASSQIGIKDGIAQTTEAAGRIGRQTSAALDRFIGRSPGERGATDILKGKARRLGKNNSAPRDRGKANNAPTQRALGKIFEQPVEGVSETAAPQSVVTVLPNDALTFSGPIPSLGPTTIAAPGAFVPFSGGGFGGGGGGGGGGGASGGGGVAVPPAVPAIISAVPEPSTWILLLFGFGAIGASVRQTKRLSRRAGHCAIS